MTYGLFLKRFARSKVFPLAHILGETSHVFILAHIPCFSSYFELSLMKYRIKPTHLEGNFHQRFYFFTLLFPIELAASELIKAFHWFSLTAPKSQNRVKNVKNMK